MAAEPYFQFIVAVAPTPAAPVTPPGWPRSARLSVAALLGVAVILLAGRWAGSTKLVERTTALRDGKLDLNLANRAELSQLPGVGPSLAGRIIEQRRTAGPLADVGDLHAVPGIGPKTLEKLRPHITAGPVMASDEGAATKYSAKAELSQPIDPNTASEDDLKKLPGIGPKMAQRIVEERARGRFRSAEDLRRVSGIGAKTMEKLRPYLIFDAVAAASPR